MTWLQHVTTCYSGHATFQSQPIYWFSSLHLQSQLERTAQESHNWLTWLLRVCSSTTQVHSENHGHDLEFSRMVALKGPHLSIGVCTAQPLCTCCLAFGCQRMSLPYMNHHKGSQSGCSNLETQTGSVRLAFLWHLSTTQGHLVNDLMQCNTFKRKSIRSRASTIFDFWTWEANLENLKQIGAILVSFQPRAIPSSVESLNLRPKEDDPQQTFGIFWDHTYR